MISELAKRLHLRYEPTAIVVADKKPADAICFVKGSRGCVAALLMAVAKGRIAAFDRDTCGCIGGGVGLGFFDRYPDGMEVFLSNGDGTLPSSFQNREAEGFKKSPQIARGWMEEMPRLKLEKRYVLFKPLNRLEESERPEAVVFHVNADQLTALIVLANYGRAHYDAVMVPFASGCQSTCLFPLTEAAKTEPKAVVGMADLSTRPYIDADLLSFTMPYPLFQEMEQNAVGSFLDRKEWQRVEKRILKTMGKETSA